MHIALLPSADLSYNSGSVIHAKRLFQYLHKQGHRATMLGRVAPLDVPIELRAFISRDFRLLNHPVVTDRAVSTRELFVSLRASLTFLSSVHANTSIDVVHAQYASFTSMAAATLARRRAVPYVVSCFGRDLTLGIEQDPRLRRFARCSLPGAAAIIVPTPATAARVSEVVPVRPGQVSVIPVPVDDTIFTTEGRSFRRGKPLLVSVCSCFALDKGVDCTLRAYAEVVREADCDLVIAGTDDHPEQLHWRRLSTLTKELGVAERVRFVGYLSRSAVGDLLRQADALIDSRRCGNFSSVILEAQFAGCPVIASLHPGAQMMIRHGCNGLLSPVDDVAHLRDCMRRVLTTPGMLSTFRTNAQLWAETAGTRYRENSVHAAIESVYRQACAR